MINPVTEAPLYKKDVILCATHIVPLVKCFDLSTGDVLELGTGFYSTTLLDWMCEMYGRKLFSYDTDPKWAAFNKEKYQSDYHQVEHVIDLDSINLTDRHWGLVFIDHSPSARRKIDLLRLKNHADYIVIHDTQPKLDWKFRFSIAYPEFKFVHHYDKLIPFTTVVSNFKNLENLK